MEDGADVIVLGCTALAYWAEEIPKKVKRPGDRASCHNIKSCTEAMHINFECLIKFRN